MDATLVTSYSAKEGAAPTWKKGYGFHPLGAWCRNTRECLAMLLRPGNAGSNTFTEHKEVLAAALRQVPSRFRRRIIVRVDGAGASHELIKHLLSLSSARKTVLFTCGWMITAADEDAIRQLPADAWKPGTAQDGSVEQDKGVAEITDLMTRAENWPDGLRWIVRRVKPSRRQMRNLTAYEKKTGWRYSVTCTNIPDTGIEGVPGSHHPQYIDVVHREHACVETAGVRTAKAMGLRGAAIEDLAGQLRLGCRGEHRRRPRRLDPPPRPLRRPWPARRRPRTRSATGSGTSPRGSPATPASGPSPSAPTGRGRKHSSPAGSGSAPCRHPPDQHEPPSQRERRTTPARSEPVRTRARRAPRAPPGPRRNGQEAKKRMPAQSVTGPQAA